jgi:hypothetical protein
MSPAQNAPHYQSLLPKTSRRIPAGTKTSRTHDTFRSWKPPSQTTARLRLIAIIPCCGRDDLSSIVLSKEEGLAVCIRADHEFLLANRVSYVIDLNADHEIQRLRCLLHQAPLRVCRLLFLLLALLFRILTSARFLAFLSSVRTDPSFHLCVRFFHLPKSLPVPGHLCRSPAKPVANQSFRPKLPIL